MTENRCQRSDDGGQKAKDREYGMGKYSISDFRFQPVQDSITIIIEQAGVLKST